MRASKYDFQWFEKEDRRKRFRASIGRDGKLRLGVPLRQELPERIRIGFDIKQKTLAIANGHGCGIDWPRGGVLTAERLSAQVAASGLKLPVSFELQSEAVSGYWLGHVIPKRRRGIGGLQYDTEELLALYGYLVDDAVRQLAKTTPLAERRAFAMEAFCAAAEEYRPGYGPLEAYFISRIEVQLRRENKQFTAAYNHRSLEKPMGEDREDSFCLYDVLSGSDNGGIDAIEERIMAEQFQESLTTKEQRLFRLMTAEYAVSQICAELDTDEDKVIELGREIGRKRRKFYDVAY